MPVDTVWLKVDAGGVADSLLPAVGKLESGEREVVLDFSPVRRIDTSAVKALEKLAEVADEKGAKVVLCGVNADIYKVLKLTKLTARLGFLN